MSVAHRGLEWGQTGIGFLLKTWARRLTLFLQFPPANVSDGAWRGPDKGLCWLRHVETLDIIRCPFAGASGFYRVADAAGWIGENSLRQPEDLEVSLLGLIERLGQESALSGAYHDYGYKVSGHHEGGATRSLPYEIVPRELFPGDHRT